MPRDCKVGNAPHSLRATSPEDLRTLLAGYKGGPVHIHIAEQTREVEDVQAWLGRRRVEWLLDNLDVNDNWCLIHATHMSNHETEGLARSQAVAGLCPITEANLGDGIFNGAAYLNAGGVFGVGTDSNVQISLVGELRQFEYSQRLRDQSRNVLVVGEGSVGQSLYASAAKGGAQALGRNAGAIAVGNLADLVAIDSETACLWSLNKSQLLDGFIFAAKEDFITHVWSAGRHCVQEGRHIRRDEIVSRYKGELAGLVKSI